LQQLANFYKQTEITGFPLVFQIEFAVKLLIIKIVSFSSRFFAQTSGISGCGKLRKTLHELVFHILKIFSTSFPQAIVDKKVSIL